MDLLTNDLTTILSLTTAVLSMVAAAFPFLKKAEEISLANFLEKYSSSSILLEFFKILKGYMNPYKKSAE